MEKNFFNRILLTLRSKIHRFIEFIFQDPYDSEVYAREAELSRRLTEDENNQINLFYNNQDNTSQSAQAQNWKRMFYIGIKWNAKRMSVVALENARKETK